MASWIRHVKPPAILCGEVGGWQLGAGEAEAIAVAMEMGISTILLDEKAGRYWAARCGLAPLGTLGVLLLAKKNGIIGELAPLLDSLREKAKFRVSDAVLAEVLRIAG